MIPYLLWVTALHPQTLPDPPSYSKSDKELGDEYIRKNKHQRRTGFVLLVASVGVATLSASSSGLDTPGGNSLFYLGTAGALCSVPLFLSAAKNKDKGEMYLRMQSMPVANGKGKKIGAIGIGIRLGK